WTSRTAGAATPRATSWPGCPGTGSCSPETSWRRRPRSTPATRSTANGRPGRSTTSPPSARRRSSAGAAPSPTAGTPCGTPSGRPATSSRRWSAGSAACGTAAAPSGTPSPRCTPRWRPPTADGRSSSTACRSTSPASGTSWTASNAPGSGPPTATARSGPGSRAERPARTPRATHDRGRRPSVLCEDDDAVVGRQRERGRLVRVQHHAVVGRLVEVLGQPVAERDLPAPPRRLGERREVGLLARHEVVAGGLEVDLRTGRVEQVDEHVVQIPVLAELRQHQADQLLADHEVVGLGDLRDLPVGVVVDLADDGERVAQGVLHVPQVQ